MPKISELAALATPTDNDLVPIVDLAATPDETKKTTWAQIKTALLAQLSVATTAAKGLMDTADQDILYERKLRSIVYEELAAAPSAFVDASENAATWTRVVDDAGALGVYSAALNTTAGAATIVYAPGGLGTVGDGQLRIVGRLRPLILADATDNFILGIGIGSTATFAAAHGAWILFDRTVSTANWLARTRNGGTTTTVDTGIPVSTSYDYFEIIVNADRTSVAFKINGTTVATVTTNIPPAATTLYAMFRMERVAGTTNRTANVDLIAVDRTFTVSRGT